MPIIYLFSYFDDIIVNTLFFPERLFLLKAYKMISFVKIFIF